MIAAISAWATGKFDGRANAHPGPPLAVPLWDRPLRLAGNAFLIALKVNMTLTYVNKNEEQLGTYLKGIFKE